MPPATPSNRLRRFVAPVLGLVLAAPLLPLHATSASAATNLVSNSGFESGTGGWFPASGTALSRSSNAAAGSYSAKVSNWSGSARTVVLNDSANTVPATVKGTPVTATAWVQTDAPGTTVGVRLMEYAGSTLHGQARGTVWLSGTGWQKVSVTYVPVTTGASLDLNVLGWAVPSRKSVRVDDVTASVGATAVAPAPAPTTPAPAPTTPRPAPAPAPAPTTTTPAPAPTTTTPAPAPPVAAPAPPAAPAGWRQVWSDEFSGSSVNTGAWNVRNNAGNSNEASYLLARNVTQADGILSITAKRESAGGREYTSGYVDTIGKQSFGIGTRWEIRAKVPTQAGSSGGLWPAFWLRSNETGGEIDVAEFYGSPHPHLANAHRNVDHIVHEDTNGGKGKAGVDYLLPGGAQPSDGYHTYAVEVLADGIHFYVDGVKSFSVLRSTHPWIGPMLGGTWNIRLNFQVGKSGSWATAPTSATRFPATFAVDYVRIYQR